MPSIDFLVDQYLNYLLVEKGLSKKTWNHTEAISQDIPNFLTKKE